MWQDSGGQDPGGGGPPLNQEFSDLKDQCEQQQVLIAQLKEMLRKNKDQSNVTQEKVDEYMNTLTRMNARVKKGNSNNNNKRKDDVNLNRSNIDIPAKSKIDLLRQQVAENKAKLAERDKSQKGIEEMVTQIQAQLDDSQQWINQTPLNLSLTLQDDKIEYNQNCSSEELYNILLMKEKRITELVNKTQKLESNILDLQENLKEKDSVIDARTKAITLMTENLSKKSKGTLDALDETKEQMRKMQENFVKLESEMKNRQMKLWEDLRLKNYEIAELQELNNKLQQNNKELLEKTTNYDQLIETIQEKDKQIDNLQKDLENSHDEINKLNKQLDDNNKNMIKIKAQNKSKIKELTKKIDNFKKINDINNEYVKLEAENCKLNQKIAELEEEKGNLQLKLMEIDSNKGSEIPIKSQKELNEELENKEKLLADSLLKITSLENEITSLKLEIDTLTEKLNNSPKFEHVDQVKTEMKSIQFEEQLDDLRKENQQLIITNQLIINEKDERIELLLKEKQQLTQKLDHYIQENIELIDKLEKLSAEKVSSAESIEIVENLTQQEKLELEAYQKSTNNNDNNTINDNNLKASDENLQQTDLNETVNELTEETSELLQKIELFTIERREVMEKMEQLKQENNNLILKMNEIENNRDILAETYEQLQNEKEELLKKFDEIQQENNKLRIEFTNNKDLDELNNKYQRVIDENQQLLLKLKEIEMELNKIRNINDELMNEITMKQQLWESTNKENENLKLKLEELENIKNDLDQQLEKYQDDFENNEFEHRKLLESKDNEILKLIKERDNIQSVVEDLQTTINKLRNQLEENTSGDKKKIDELMNKNKEQLEKMKKIAANLKKKSQAYQELEDEYRTNQEKWVNETQEKDEKITNLLQQLNNLEIKNTELEHKINELRLQLEKSNEMSLQQELQQTKENIIDIESNENLLKSKIQELEMLLESKDNELLKSNERIMKLEEGIRFVEERRMSLEKKAIELGTELEEKKQNFEQISQNEDLLEQRLIALVEHDEIIEKRLENTISENQELNQQIIKLNQISDELNQKLEESRNNLERIHNLESRINELENNNIELERIKQQLENDLKNLQYNYDQLMIDTRDEFDKMNNDWQQQFDQMFKEKSDLMVRCERLEDELKDILDKETSFNNEFILYKTKLEQSESEIRNYEEQIGQLLNENRIRLKQAEEIVELQQKLDEKTNKCEELSEKISVLEKELSNKIAENLNENQFRLKQAEEIVGLQQQLEEKDNKCEELNGKISVLEKELLNKTAENTVSSIVEQAEIKVNVDEIPKIVWSEQSNDPFEFLTNQTIVEDVIEKKDIIPIESDKDELQNKIKTLEFMLFNVEKERDDALLQCQQLTDELTKFVYDKVTNTERLESEIIPDDQDRIDNRENLQKIEFEPTKLPIVDEKTAIDNEEICQKKTAYICTDNSGNNQINRDTFGETEDGWGWSPEEIKLEEEHLHKDDIGVLKDQIYILEIERNNYIEQIKQLQIKSGKLIKKLKEFKQKNDELNRNKRIDDDLNLNQTIHDEFKLQIEQIEKRLKETLNDLERERYEKQSLQKRCDTLMITNQRMIDMKEKYENELLSWQQNCRELNAKLERYEWGHDDGFLTTEQQNIDNKTDNELTINQLNETIKELQLDNDELQKLLEEQRQLRVEAEKMKLNDELKQQNQQLQDQINESLHKIEKIQLENDELKLDNDELQKLLEEQRQLRVEAEKMKINDELKQQNQQLQDQINESLHQIEKIQLENDELQKLLEEQRQLRIEAEKEKDQINESLNKIETIQLENDKLNRIIVEKQTIINDLEKNIEQLQQQLTDSNNNINKLTIERDQLLNDLKMKEIEINSLQLELEKLNKNIVNLNETIQLNQTEIEQLTNNLTKHNIEIELLNQQWQQQVDQRGIDVAESWKLHMETIETNYRKEINELETKIHTLMNENNELRKNVDIEIRNEIDRQHIIDDLTKQLQEKQKQIEYRTNEFDKKCEVMGKIIEKLHIDNDDDDLLLLNCEKFYKDFENNCRKLEEFETRELLLKQELQQKNDTITNLTNQLQQIQNLKEYENDNIENLQQSLHEYQQINATITAQLQEKNQQYEYLNNEFCNNQILLQERDREIIDLKLKLTNIEEIHEKNDLLIKQQLNELDNLKQLLNNKDRDFEDLQKQLNQSLEQINEYKMKLDKFNEISNELNDKNNEIINLQQRIDEQNRLLDEENQQLTELRHIIEDQVIKIENLKRELYEKCNDYDSLIAEMDMNRMNEHLKIKEEYRQQIKTQQQQQDDDDLTEPVNRAELDLALYMLHQRDVRCEELTVELTQLLEERDTLQLRLSNALREKEEIYKKFKIDENLIGGSGSSSIEATSSSMITTNISDDNKHLDNKLSELKTVGYKRDKTIVDEQEMRHLQELSILQQHKDVAAKLPPEAAARLVDASYTLSRDVQSPSKVLLNWLWGKSTPKVNNI